MELSALNIPEKKVLQLQRTGIQTAEDLLYFWPKKYIGREKLTGILPPDRESVLTVIPQSIKRGLAKTSFITAYCAEERTGVTIRVTWFNQIYRLPDIQAVKNKRVLVCGHVTRVPGGTDYSITAPAVFTDDIDGGLKIYPIYKTVKGMAASTLEQYIQSALTALSPLEDTLPAALRRGKMEYQEAVLQTHAPASETALERAQARLRWDDLVYFALRIELNYQSAALGSPYGIPFIRKTAAAIRSLPFALTADQDTAIRDILQTMRAGQRINALIQGDVGCGKTILAFLAMIAIAENGCQAALMAPTQILAKQHFDDLRALTEPLGIRAAYAGGTMKKAEQRALAAGIASGEISLVVGTQALLSQGLQFKKLALVVTDEEHKYGVLQRESLVRKAADGTHVISMSATPIPRSLAQAVYGTHLKIYSIRTKPAGRQPVKTGIARSMEAVFTYIKGLVARGNQAYVVCPMVEPSEKREGVRSVQEIYSAYKRELAPAGIHVGIVTGRTKKEEAAHTIADFKANKIHVLIATTVIEVGVNVPNAVAIVIHNAELFGLAQLHQLRGRVGRGTASSACVLVTEERDNPRLQVMCSTSDGFEIAEQDLRLRGAGDLIGTAQSGTERYLSLALRYPEDYADAQKAARALLKSGDTCLLLERAIQDAADGKGGQIIGGDAGPCR